MKNPIFDSNKTIFTYGCDFIPLGIEWSYDRSKTCCYTGHRPKNLPPTNTSLYRSIEDGVKFYTRMLVLSGYDTFMTGMATGFDLIAASELLYDPVVKDKVNIICAVPFYYQLDGSYSAHERKIYTQAAERAKAVIVNCERRMNGCYKLRNQFMVNYSSALINYVKSEKGSQSGSMQTVRMAQRAGLDIYNINDENNYNVLNIERNDNP